MAAGAYRGRSMSARSLYGFGGWWGPPDPGRSGEAAVYSFWDWACTPSPSGGANARLAGQGGDYRLHAGGALACAAIQLLPARELAANPAARDPSTIAGDSCIRAPS